MKKQLVIIAIIAILVSVGLSGCTSNPVDTEKNKLVGTWSFSDGSIITFFSNGTFIDRAGHGTWELKNGKFVSNEHNITHVYNYSFSNNDKTFTLTAVSNTSYMILTKQ